MDTKSQSLVNLIFKKLKKYKAKEIFLEKENLNEFIISLLNENWIQREYKEECYNKKNFKICIWIIFLL